MKQLLMILLLGFISLGDIFAQDLKKINYQFDCGSTLSIPYKSRVETSPELDNPSKTDYSSNFGYFLEGLISYNLKKYFSIGTGVNYNMTVLKINSKTVFNKKKGTLINSYLTIPVFIKYQFSDKLPITISAGPYISILMNSNEKGNVSIDTTTIVDPVSGIGFTFESEYKYDTDLKKFFPSIDYGISLQLDYEILLSHKLKGVVMTRFNYGLRDQLENAYYLPYNSAYEWKNYNLMVGLGLKL